MNHTEMIMVIEAHREGKAIQYSKDGHEWIYTQDPSWNFSRVYYRVKPEPEYEKINVDNNGRVFIGGKDGAINERKEYVEIKALEDALSIIRDMNADPERRSESFEQYRHLQELIK